MLGVGPYITASIIMQLSTIMFPKLRPISRKRRGWFEKVYTIFSLINLSPCLNAGLCVPHAFTETENVIGQLTTFDIIVSNILIITCRLCIFDVG